MLTTRLGRLLTLLCLALPAKVRADEQTLQLWTNFMVEWQVTSKHFLGFDVEPKILLVGDGQWSNVDYTQTYEFAPTRWLDLIAEGVAGYTHDDQNPDATEVTPRLGARFHIWRKRLLVRDTFRFENRTRFFSDDTHDSVFRWRNRVELRYPFNRAKTSEAGAIIGLFDWEYFVPLDDDLKERYASRHRLRGGICYRFTPSWRMDLIYLWQRSRNTADQPFDSIDHVIDVRLRRAF